MGEVVDRFTEVLPFSWVQSVARMGTEPRSPHRHRSSDTGDTMSQVRIAPGEDVLAVKMRRLDSEFREAITALACEIVTTPPVHPRPVGMVSLWRAVTGRNPR